MQSESDWYCYSVWSRKQFPSGMMAEVVSLTYGRARIHYFQNFAWVDDHW
jgi:hypothetical protein